VLRELIGKTLQLSIAPNLDMSLIKKLAYIGERPLSSDLVLLKRIQELRQAYPVRHIADAALLTMLLGIVSRAAIDQTAFGAKDQETRVRHILEVCMGVLFREPVPQTAKLTSQA
jgi:hypothetical protein